MWSKNANLPNEDQTWQGALDYVKSINNGTGLGGYHDWRLPNRKELFSLIDRSKYIPPLPASHPFQNVQSNIYWSSTTSAGYTVYAWFVHMVGGGLVDSYYKSGYYYVWPVRSGQVGGLKGNVTDLSTGNYLSSVNVSTLNKITQTGQFGYYNLRVPSGTYDVTFSKTGYQSQIFSNVNIIEGQFAELNVELQVVETVSIPTIPSGPTTGITGTSYSYTTGASSSNLGHSVEYQFDWNGDGSDLSSWGSATQLKTWATPGTYNVRARARCTIDTSVVSSWSGTLSATISAPETVSPPSVLSGPITGFTGTSYSYTASGSTSSYGHQVKYQFDWKGDGTDLSSWGAATQSQTWATPGTYNIKARARCATHTSLVSEWSGTLPVIITVPETVSAPDTPWGPAVGITGVKYSFELKGSSSNVGHAIQYLVDWGDGTNTGWGPDPSNITSPETRCQVGKSWDSPGTYSIKTKARCGAHTSIESNWSNAFNIIIFASEVVLIPTIPKGPTSGNTGKSYSYSTGGSTSNLGHPVEYQFDWKGDGTDISSWGSATQSKIWTTAGTYNVRARARCTLDTSVMSGWSGSIQVTIVLSRPIRTLPRYYTPSLPLTVVIAINPTAATQVYSVEDSPPNGWTVSNINENGQWDDVNKKAKWGIFFDNNPRTLTYEVTPPVDETGTKTFAGTASFDGINVPIGGDLTIELGMFHPADLSHDFRIVIDEATAYGAAWRAGETWPVAPNPIPIAYVTNAAYLWKVGEVYHYDGQTDPPWATGALAGGSSLKNQSFLESNVALAARTATRDLSNCYPPSVAMSISITVTPGRGTKVYAVEDSPPIGWIVSDINEGGGWDDVNKKVKWGPFFDHNNRIVTYKVTPPTDETGTKTFSGAASFDGKNVVIGGELILGRCTSSPLPDLTGSWTIPPKQTCKNTSRGQKCTIRGTFTISNIGNYSASSTYVDFYLSDNDNYNEGDILLKSVRTGKIKAGKNKAIKLSYIFPLGVNVTGKYIIAVIEKLAEELDETNNIIVFGPIQ